MKTPSLTISGKTVEQVRALIAFTQLGNLRAAQPAASALGRRLNEEAFSAASDRLATTSAESAQVSHVQWVAEKVRTIASGLLTEAQLREEETIANLISAKNACDETVAPAEAVLAAAVAVEEIERNIDWLTQLIENPTPTGDAPADDEDDTPAGECDA